MSVKLLRTSDKNVKQRESDDVVELRLEDFLREFEIGADVWVISKGQWHKAKVISVDQSPYPADNTTSVPCFKVHYHRWSKRYDEWMFSDSLMLQNPENVEKAITENEVFLQSLSIKKKTGRTSGQKENAVAEVAVTKTCVSGMSRSIQEPVNVTASSSLPSDVLVVPTTDSRVCSEPTPEVDSVVFENAMQRSELTTTSTTEVEFLDLQEEEAYEFHDAVQNPIGSGTLSTLSGIRTHDLPEQLALMGVTMVADTFPHHL